MTKFRIPVYWEMGEILEIEAESLKEAIKIAEDMDDIPENGDYVDGSFTADEEFAKVMND